MGDQPATFAMLCRDCEAVCYVGEEQLPDVCFTCGSQNIRIHPELFSLTIAHIDCDAFYASIEKRDKPSLAEKPVIVGGGDRGVVAAACYIAREYGVRSAMPAWQALKKCPDAVVIKPRMAHYLKIGKQVHDMMLSLTPLVQPLSIDEAFLDLSGTQNLHKSSPAEALVRLQKRIFAEVGITASIGLGGNKSLAKLASGRDKPNGFFVVGVKDAAAWLAPQPVSILYGVGKVAINRLNRAGYLTCASLGTADPRAMVPLLGSQAARIIAMAQGIDARPVVPDRATKSVSNETTFSSDISDYKDLEAALEQLCTKLAKRLKTAQLGGRTVTLKLKRADHQILTRSRRLDQPIDKAHILFEVGQSLLLPETKKDFFYRLLGIGVTNLTEVSLGSLFDLRGGLDDKRNRLEQAIDSLEEKLGDGIIKSGRQFVQRQPESDDDELS